MVIVKKSKASGGIADQHRKRAASTQQKPPLETWSWEKNYKKNTKNKKKKINKQQQIPFQQNPETTRILHTFCFWEFSRVGKQNFLSKILEIQFWNLQNLVSYIKL